jgi:hypothetical protein
VAEVVLVAPSMAPAAVVVVVAMPVAAVVGEGGRRRRHEQRTAEKNRTKDALHQSIPFI